MSVTSESLPLEAVPAVVLDFEPTKRRGARPRLECPIAPELNPYVEFAHVHTVRWAIEQGLVAGEGETLARFRGARFTWLAARAYPRVGQVELELISDWITFLFFYDDLCDTQKATGDDYLARLQRAEDRLIAIVEGAEIGDDASPLERALAEIRARVATRADAAWLTRLATHLREYIEGCRWERILRLQHQVPSLATYTKLRLLISAVYPCFDFAGICIDGSRTHFADNVRVQQLEVMANNYICWVNDIYGVDKELGEHTTSNLVIVLAHEFGLSWDDALDRAIEMCNAEFAAFTALEQVMLRLGDTDCRAYVDALKSWMRGNLDWYAETLRYGLDEGESLACCWVN